MNSHQEEDSLDLMSDALVRWAGSGALIIDHMVRWGEGEAVQSSTAHPFESLKKLIRSTLEPLKELHAAGDPAAAAAVIADAVETAAGEILLVKPESSQLDHDGRGS